MLEKFVNFLYTWQTLAAGLLALIGAIITVIVMSCQIYLQSRHSAKQREARLRASRAFLVVPLEEICNQCKDCADLLEKMLGSDRESYADLLSSVSIATLSMHSLQIVKESVELGNDDLARQLSLILQGQQVRSSRLLGWRAEDVFFGPHNFYRLIILNLEIYARASSLFDYARFDSDAIVTGLNRKRMNDSLNIINFRLARNKYLLQSIYREYPENESSIKFLFQLSRLMKRCVI